MTRAFDYYIFNEKMFIKFAVCVCLKTAERDFQMIIVA